MQVHHVAAAILSLSSAFFTVSCLQSPTAPPEAGGKGASAPVIGIEDDGDPFGGDPDLGGGIGSEPPASGVGSDPGSSGWGSEPPASSAGSGSGGSSAEAEGSFTYKLCCLLKYSLPLARQAFCRSQPDAQVRRACYSHVNDKPVEWQNWCYDTFYDE